MIRILFTGFHTDLQDQFTAESLQTEAVIEWSDNGRDALSRLAEEKADLCILSDPLPDMSGPDFIKAVIHLNPMQNCAVASALPHREFHDTYEGMGVLMQLPLIPDKADMTALLAHLERIIGIGNSLLPPEGGGFA